VKRLLVFIAIIIGLFSLTASAVGAAVVSSPLGSGGACQDFSGLQNSPAGRVIVMSDRSSQDVTVRLHLRDLVPSRGYYVWLAEVNVQDGTPIGCAANVQGALADSRGQLNDTLTFTLPSGEHTIQVIVNEAGQFTETPVAVSNQSTLSVP
jgi:hypothetical protein